MTNPLDAGTVAQFASSMAAYMDQAMKNEWFAVKGEALPVDQGADDRKILFAAIAQGVLKFLADHSADLITSEESAGSGTGKHHHTMAFTVDAYTPPLP